MLLSLVLIKKALGFIDLLFTATDDIFLQDFCGNFSRRNERKNKKKEWKKEKGLKKWECKIWATSVFSKQAALSLFGDRRCLSDVFFFFFFFS